MSHSLPKLKPCPFCGGTDKLSIEDNDVGCFWVICDNVGAARCGCEGPYRHSRQSAADAWNNRAPRRHTPERDSNKE